MSAEKVVDGVEDAIEILQGLRKQLYKQDSPLNMRRDTLKMFTSSQLMLNLTDLVLELNFFESKVEKFHGVVNKLPEGRTPRIKVVVKKINL
jgi:hypothetical protein